MDRSQPLVAIVLAGALLSACMPPQGGYFGAQPAPVGPPPPPGPGSQLAAPPAGGCQGVCDHYFQCKGGASPADQQSCVNQCAQSNPDPEGLAHLQAMECSSLVGLIDGTTPAASTAGSSVAAKPVIPKPSPGPAHVQPIAPGATVPPAFGANAMGGRAAATASGAMGPTGPIAPATGPGTRATCASPRTPSSDPELYALLTRSAWCSFSYSGGTTHNSRAVLGQDGVATRGSASETSHSGQLRDGAGNQAGAWGTGNANQGNERGCWRLDGHELMFSQDGRQWVPGGLRVTVNSSGWPILNIGGTEFSMCN